jgi:hypothetical protein
MRYGVCGMWLKAIRNPQSEIPIHICHHYALLYLIKSIIASPSTGFLKKGFMPYFLNDSRLCGSSDEVTTITGILMFASSNFF